MKRFEVDYVALTQHCNELLAGLGGLKEYKKLIPDDCMAIPSASAESDVCSMQAWPVAYSLMHLNSQMEEQRQRKLSDTDMSLLEEQEQLLAAIVSWCDQFLNKNNVYGVGGW